MKKNNLGKVLSVLAISIFIANNAYSDKIVNAKKINENNYNYLEIVVEQDYIGQKTYSSKDLPLAVGKNYEWKKDVDSLVCSNTCGTGTQTTSAVCIENLGSNKVVVNNTQCEEKLGEYVSSPKPCSDWSGCNASYMYSEWENCSLENIQKRNAICVDKNNSVIPESACLNIPKDELEQSCQYVGTTCKNLLSEYPSATTGFYYMSPDGTGPYKVYCDMDFKGGGWMSIVASVNSASVTTESPTPSNPGYLEKNIMIKFALRSSQVTIKQNGSNNAIVSTPNSHPIVSLRSGLDMAQVDSSNYSFWTSDQGLATAAKLTRTCGPKVNYPWLLWTCGNNYGIVLNKDFGMWNCNYNGSECAGTKFNYTAMIR